MLSRNLNRESDRIKLALLRILADFWGGVSRPVFLFFRGVVRGFHDVVIFRQIKTTRHFQIYIDVSAEKMAFISDKSRPKLNRENWSVSTIFRNAILKKRQTALNASRKMAGETSRKAGPIHPFPCSNTPAKVLKPRFPDTKTGLP